LILSCFQPLNNVNHTPNSSENFYCEVSPSVLFKNLYTKLSFTENLNYLWVIKQGKETEIKKSK